MATSVQGFDSLDQAMRFFETVAETGPHAGALEFVKSAQALGVPSEQLAAALDLYKAEVAFLHAAVDREVVALGNLGIAH